jgi:hypothetical protein
MQEPAIARWNVGISDTDFAKLKAGFEPQDHDDKWRYFVTDESENGNISIHVIRTGTRVEHYILSVKPGEGSSGGGKIETITWEQNLQGRIRISVDLAKKEVVLITRSVLGCDFEALPEIDFGEVFNHPAYRLEDKTPTN